MSVIVARCRKCNVGYFGDPAYCPKHCPTCGGMLAVEESFLPDMRTESEAMTGSSLTAIAVKNGWQCFRDGQFTWLAGANCPNFGSSDCPITMRGDVPCSMTEDDESELARHYGTYAGEKR